MSDINREQIAEWVERLLNEDLSTEAFDALEQTLLNSPDARNVYLDLMHQHAHLQMEPADPLRASPSAAVTEDRTIAPPMEATPATTPRASRPWWTWLTLASVCLLLAWSARGLLENDELVVAVIAESWDADWGECTLPTAVDQPLSPGTLRIERGLATIRFRSGAEVTLESPAELRIETQLRGHLLSGTAVVQVPDEAHGFVLATPTAVAIDHGTAFAATVDASSQTAWIEVLDGEVEVQHAAGTATRRLVEQERIVASPSGLSDAAPAEPETELVTGAARTLARAPDDATDRASTLCRITTAQGRGGDASVSRGRSAVVQAHSRSDLVLIKNAYPQTQQFDRKGYFRFDLAARAQGKILDATFQLNVHPTGLGFASRVDDCEFVVFGLTAESQDAWSAPLAWASAPASDGDAAAANPKQSVELGRFTVPRGLQHGPVTISGKPLVEFLSADTNQLATLIVVRATCEREAGGLVHGFCNHDSAMGAPPALELRVANAP